MARVEANTGKFRIADSHLSEFPEEFLEIIFGAVVRQVSNKELMAIGILSRASTTSGASANSTTSFLRKNKQHVIQ